MEAINIGKLRLYEHANDSPNSLGLGYLTGTLSANVNRVANQAPTLTMTYAKDGNLANQFEKGMLIMADMGPEADEQNQMFRIAGITKANDQITITANHIGGDLAYNVITKTISIANASASDAFNAIKANLADPMPQIDLKTDVVKVANLGWDFTNIDNASSLLLTPDQTGDQPQPSMVATYGGEFTFNNYHYGFWQHAGKHTGIIIKWGQNLTSLSKNVSVDGTYNAIMPYATFTPNEVPDNSNGLNDYTGQGVVQYVGSGGAETYDSPFKGQQVNGHVKNGATYQVTKTATDNTSNGNTWYMISNNQWIDEHFFTFDKSGAYVVNKIKGIGTVSLGDNSDNNGLITAYTGVGTIEYSGLGGVLLYNSPFNGKVGINKYLKNGTNWKIFRKATDENGQIWYDLGGSQWVPSMYFSISKTGDYATTPSTGIIETTGTVTSKTGPGTGSNANWKPANGSKWKVNHIATDGAGNTWYQVANLIWVQAGDTVNFTSQGTVADSQDNENIAIAKASGQLPVYSAPNGTKVTNKTVKVGQQLTISAQADNNGRTWYEIGENEWVDASYFSFSQNTDVSPDQDATVGSDVEVEDQTIYLDGYVLKSPFIKDDEPLRIQAVDLSQYNVRDTDKLREVAEAYIKEYRIGYPNITLTVSYNQMQGDYAKLTEVDLYDTVSVQFDQLGIAETAEVNSVTWNCLTDHFDQITIGDLPITYEHALGDYVNQVTTKQVSTVQKQTTHLFGNISQAMKLQGDAQKAAVIKVAQDLGLAKQTWTQDYDRLQTMMDTVNSTVSDVQNWIQGGGGGVITAYPNWSAPTELRAASNSGGYMDFGGNGLGYIGNDNVLRSAIDSQGRVVAEAITAGTITGVKLVGVDINGTSVIHSNGTYDTVLSGTNGLSISNGGSRVGINAETILMSSDVVLNWDYGCSIRYVASPAAGMKPGLYVHQPNGDYRLGGN